ncbi:DUF805 domain-containing protein [Poseidonocella sp. HB161398]|uniref:DUF805 domain-containing protein n=1 Tax=Poseidonocella sp. HB161398 TaxID=2320855 RepID=UPI001109E953|nr:DUF805 domain-containing protein [Poseidonocella sp. HB161398]
MGFAGAVGTCLRKYATFAGRAPRSEFWWFALFVYGGLTVCGLIDLALFGETVTVETETVSSVQSETQFAPFSSVYGLLVLLPYISVTVRRLHDIGRNGWWYWIMLVPLVGFIVMLVWMLTGGTPGPNRYGENPLPATGDGG